MSEQDKKYSNGGWVLACFVAFFGVVAAVNAVFVFKALDTHSGVVTDNPYETGLAYNDLLQEAKHQADLDYDFSYENGVITLQLPVSNAEVKGYFFRSVKDGYDFEAVFEMAAAGIYTFKPDLPLKGLWTVKVSAVWDDNQKIQQKFQISKEIMVP
ncbi:MAG: FixH family protein [Alphaproteobacteria bacterium]